MKILRSMTSFANLSRSLDEGKVEVYIKAVNSRFMEADFSISDELRWIEPDLKQLLKAEVSRGKLNINVEFKPNLNFEEQVDDERLIKVSRLMGHANNILKMHHDHGNAEVNLLELLAFPGVIKTPELDREKIKAQVVELFKDALKIFIHNREVEGQQLKSVIEARLKSIELTLEPVKDNLDALVSKEKERIEKRVQNLQLEIDEARLHAEIALICQKADIAEEYDRLQSHIKLAYNLIAGDSINVSDKKDAHEKAQSSKDLAQLSNNSPIQSNSSLGKHLDFLMQEMLRESNTIASKASNLELSNIAIELKLLVEQIREQVQNIE